MLATPLAGFPTRTVVVFLRVDCYIRVNTLSKRQWKDVSSIAHADMRLLHSPVQNGFSNIQPEYNPPAYSGLPSEVTPVPIERMNLD